jgi:hypothetical protein
MSLLFIDSYDYRTAGTATGGRNGTRCTGIAGGGPTVSFASTQALVSGAAIKFNPLGTSSCSFIFSEQFSLQSLADGSLQVVRGSSTIITGTPDPAYPLVRSNATTAANVVFANTFASIEVKADFATGALYVRRNGEVVIALTGCDLGGAGTFTSMRWFGSASSSSTVFDDWYVCNGADSGITGLQNNDFLGDVRVKTIYPNAVGTNTALIPTPASTAIALNAGGGAVAPFSADANFSSSATASTGTAITIPGGLVNPAPMAVYQTERYVNSGTAGANFAYTFSNLAPGINYKVRLHFSETFWNAANARFFNVLINGTQVLTSTGQTFFDVFALSGGKFIAYLEEYTAAANISGQIIVTIANTSPAVDRGKINGVELISLTTTPNFSTVDENPLSPAGTAAPNAADYNQSATPDALDTYNYENLSIPGKKIVGVQFAPLLSVNDGATKYGIKGFTHACLRGGNLTEGARVSIPANADSYVLRIYQSAPSDTTGFKTSNGWTEAELNATEFGIRVKA